MDARAAGIFKGHANRAMRGDRRAARSTLASVGFRFRRSVRLLPGVRMNVSTGGLSLSVGPRGSSLNLSSRGARATFGLPGTGLSWSTPVFQPQPDTARAPTGSTKAIRSTRDLVDAVNNPSSTVVYTRSQRRLSATQLAALHARLARQEARQEAQQEIERMEAQLEEVVNAWREQVAVPSAEEYRAALAVRPFRNEDPVPARPNLPVEEAALTERVRREIEVASPRGFLSRAAGLGAGVGAAATAALATLAVLGSAAVMFDAIPPLVVALGPVPVGALFGLVAGVFAERVAAGRWRTDMNTRVAARTADEWPRERARLEQAHAVAVQEYRERDARARAAWDAAEVERVAWAQRLTSGDADAIDAAVSASLDDLDFPFESHCTVAVEDSSSVFVDLDLPEIEDVIPETRLTILKNGSTKETKRKAEERNAAYARLVSGICIAVAATAFGAAPTVEFVVIAAYTQRKKRGSDEVEDVYVIEAKIPREVVVVLEPATDAPLDVLSRCQTRIDAAANLALKKIAPPAWVAELRSEA